MIEMSFDADGYPTEETLKEIETFDLLKPTVLKRLPEFMQLVLSHWHWEDFMYSYNQENGCMEMHTGGWSGNESIIDAMQRNRTFWSIFWYKSIRGGHYWFKLYQYGEDGNTRTFPKLKHEN